MLSYPTESQKGLFIGIFWGIFNLGAVVGASVSLGQNFHSTVRAVFPWKNHSTDCRPVSQGNSGTSRLPFP